MEPTVTAADRELMAWHRARSMGARLARLFLADHPNPDQAYLLATALRYAGDCLERSAARSRPTFHCKPRRPDDAEQLISGTVRVCLRKITHRISYRGG